MEPTEKQKRYEREKRLYQAQSDKMHVSEVPGLIRKIDEKRGNK